MKAWFRSWRETSLTPFSIPLFRSLWLAALASHIGAVVQSVGASWTMTILDPSPQMVSLVAAAAMLPMVILALPAGALADTVDRRRLMLISQIIGACAAMLLSFLAFTHNITPWVLIALTAFVGVAVALHQPAWQAALGDFVPRKELPAAITLNVLAFNTARSVGPVIGGALIAVAGTAATFLLNAFAFMTLIATLATRALPRVERGRPPESMFSAMAAGVRFVRLSPQLKRIFLRGGLFGFGASALLSLLPLIARSQIGGGPVAFGALVSALGCGSFVGAIIATRVRSSVGGNRMLGFATVAYAAATIVFAVGTRLLVSVPMAFVAGVASISVLTTTRTAVHLSCPRWVVGRAVSFGLVTSFGCMTIGAMSWGWIAGVMGLEMALLMSGAFLAITLCLHRLAPLPVVSIDTSSEPP
jgi:predicted MFS family arabinose efflux permease